MATAGGKTEQRKCTEGAPDQPPPTGADLNHMVWETLTHGEVGAVGLPPVGTVKP